MVMFLEDMGKTQDDETGSFIVWVPGKGVGTTFRLGAHHYHNSRHVPRISPWRGSPALEGAPRIPGGPLGD